METTENGTRASDQCDSTRIHEEITGNPSSKNTSEVSGAKQMLEELVRKYEEHRDKKYDNDSKLQRLYDTRVSETESKQVDNDEFDRSSRHEIGDDGKGRRQRRRRWRTRRGLVRRLDGTEGRNRETRKGTVQWILSPVWIVEIRRRIASRQQQCATIVGSGSTWQNRSLRRAKESRQREEAREGTRENGKGKTGKGWWESQKGKGRGKGLQSVNEWDEWDQTEDYSSVPLLSMSRGEKQSETEPPDQWPVPVKRVKSMCVKTRAGSGQFVCHDKFEAITEVDHEEKTRQDRRRVRFCTQNTLPGACHSTLFLVSTHCALCGSR